VAHANYKKLTLFIIIVKFFIVLQSVKHDQMQIDTPSEFYFYNRQTGCLEFPGFTSGFIPEYLHLTPDGGDDR